MEEYLNAAIASFKTDPADDNYQKGYLAALVNCLEELHRQEAED